MKCILLLLAAVALCQGSSFYPEHYYNTYSPEYYNRFWSTFGRYGYEHDLSEGYGYGKHYPMWYSKYFNLPVERESYQPCGYGSVERYPCWWMQYQHYPTYYRGLYGNDYRYSPYQGFFGYNSQYTPYQGHYYPYGQYERTPLIH